MRCGIRAVLRILPLCFGVWCRVGRCFVFWIVSGISAWDLGGALVWVFWKVEVLGGLRN